MKFDFSNSSLKDLITDRPLVESVVKINPQTLQEETETIPITVLAVATVCMLRATPDDGKLGMTEKIRRYKLGQRLIACANSEDKILELDSDEVSLIKVTAGVMFGSMIIGQVVDFFESASNTIAV